VQAWDQTTGTDGGTVNLSLAGASGGSTAFSMICMNAIGIVNSAPSL
jgi:hypothetical protein